MPVGTAPDGAAFDTVTHEALIANAGTDNVSVICDGSATCGGPSETNQVVATVPVGTDPVWLTYDPTERQAFVSNDGSNDVTVLSDVTDTVVYSIPVGSFPEGLAYDPHKREVFVANSGDNTVSVISAVSDSVVATVPVGLGPYGVAVDPNKNWIFVTDAYGSAVSVISDATNTVVATVPVDQSPIGIAYDSSQKQMWVACTLSDDLLAISVASMSVVATVGFSRTLPYGVAFVPHTDDVFVSDTNGSNVSVVSAATDTVLGTVHVGNFPEGMAVDPLHARIYVASRDSNRVDILSSVSPMLQSPVGVLYPPYNVAYASGRHELFVSETGYPNSYPSHVDVVSDTTDSVVASITISTGYVHDLTYDPARHEVFVANDGPDELVVISAVTNAVVATVPVGSQPTGLAYDSATHEVFVANYYNANVSVVSDVTNHVVANIPVGSNPMGVAYDPGKDEVFVSNGPSNNVSVICDGGPACGGAPMKDKVVASVGNPAVDSGPWALAYDPSENEVFATDVNTSSVSVISDVTDTVVASVVIGNLSADYPEGVAYDGWSHEVYVTDLIVGNLTVICDGNPVCGGPTWANRIVATLPVGTGPVGIVWDTDASLHKLYVADDAAYWGVAVVSDTTPV